MTKWNPFQDLQKFFDEEGGPISTVQRIGLDLAVDLYEDDGNLIAEMNLPGIDPDKVEIEIEDRLLRISGTREERKEISEKAFHSREIRRGEFERAIRLPMDIKKDRTEAEYANGVLKVIMPEVEEKRPKKIKIARKK